MSSVLGGGESPVFTDKRCRNLKKEEWRLFKQKGTLIGLDGNWFGSNYLGSNYLKKPHLWSMLSMSCCLCSMLSVPGLVQSWIQCCRDSSTWMYFSLLK